MNIFRLTVRATGIVLCLLALTACATPSQVYWDAKVKDLCEKDGGITVYKKVEISRKDHPEWEYAANGELKVPLEQYCENTCDFYISKTEQVYLSRNPEVWRSSSKLIRAEDKVVIAQSVNYARIGGDLVTVDHPSGYSCVEVGSFRSQSLSSAINIKGE